MDKIKCYLVSLVGILLFFTPLNIAGYDGVGISILSDFTKDTLKPFRLQILLVTLLLSLVVTLMTKIMKPEFILKRDYLAKVFDVGPLDLVLRCAAVIIAVLTMGQLGPEIIWGGSTGQEMVGLAFPVMILLFFAAYLLPSLLDFGLMEFIGTLATKVMRPLFTLPGRAALDTIASWVGSGSLGVMITSQEYENGGYSRREAAIIATTFSVTSISYAVFMVGYVGMSDKFPQFYGTCILCGVACAIVIPRIPPLSKFEDSYYNDVKRTETEERPPEVGMLAWAHQKAVERAGRAEGFLYYIEKGTKSLFNFWFGLIPIVLAVGTLGLIVVNYTPVFQFIAYPFELLLNLFGIPEARAAAPGMIVGFIDFFIPLPIANQIAEPMTRFVIVCMSLIQIIYLTQTGALMLRSKIGLKLHTLFLIFMERTILSLPIICLMARLLF